MVDWPQQDLLRPFFYLEELHMTEYDAFAMQETDGTLSFVYTKIPAEKIPENLNGESGHHICFVE